MSSYEEKICEAMEYIAEKAVARAGYDKTIQATIVRCEDELTGQYKVKYQDSSFYAYAASTDITYSPNTLVYILVPGNDMGNVKTILGTVKKLGADYLSLVQSAYEVIGTNCILSDEKYELCSYNKEQRVVIYDRLLGEDNSIIIDNVGAKEYFKNTNNLKIGATFKTTLDKEQQFRGQYGIHFEIAFRDNATRDTVLRDYILDSTYVEGNPYKSSGNRETFEIFELDGSNFEYINKIEVFCYGFPLQEEEKPNDIFISKLDISGVNMISQELLNTQCLTILTPNGAYFDDNHFDNEVKVLEGQVRIKGKVINSSLKTVKYFWFIENAGVDIYHEKYNINGGAGWECLNDFVDGDWKQGSYQLKITKAQNHAVITRYKCVVLYNDLILSRVQEIQNLSSEYNISIVSDSGTKFFYDNGTPTLTCLINGEEKADYTYIWAETDYKNITTCLEESIEDNNIYNTAESRYNEILNAIKAETMLLAASQQELDEKKAIIDSYNLIQRVEKNKIYKIQMNEVISFKSFKCSVYNKQGLYIGTTTIVLTNDLQKKNEYTLVINNGTQVFKYDESGVSPTSPSLLKPMEIKPLSFTIFNPEGIEVDTRAVDLQQVYWKVPIENTMLSITKTSYGEPIVENGKEIYTGYAILNYNIGSRYNLDNYDNDIELEVKYQDILLTAKTNFTFTKEGNSGTNGTGYICKIVPNTEYEQYPLYPMIINGELNYEVDRDKNQQQWFNVEFWEGDTRIYKGASSELVKGKELEVNWSILRNKYSTRVGENDPSSITLVDEKEGLFSYIGYIKEDTHFANIIKCQIIYDKVEYYATLPLITAITKDDYLIELKEKSGFREVLYSTDGQNPFYVDVNPFELIVSQKINNIIEDVSLLQTDKYKLTYEWKVLGKIFNTDTKEWILQNNLIPQKTLQDNQYYFKPISSFNGECVNNAIECIVYQKSSEVARIHIPIHMLLNRYGNAAINGWDGNSISIDKNGNGVILAPQIGAGKKEKNDNSFTGVLMGSVKEAGKNNIETGLFGYHKGSRSIFLNAETGTATFGKTGGGQIIIDPSTSKAQIKSGNYATGTNGAGMLIDLTEPSIRFGSGNFSVSANGSLTSKSGTIGGWTIGTNTLKGGSLTLNSEGSIIGPRWSITKDGYATFTDVKITNTNSSQSNETKLLDFSDFYVRKDGYMQASNANIIGTINTNALTATGGTIGGWNISGTQLSGNGKISGGSISGSSITGGSIDITTSGGGYLRAGKTTHPAVSALNVGDSIVIKDHAIGYGNNPGGNAFYAQSNFAVNGWYKVVNENGEHTGSTLNNQNVCIGITVDSNGKVTQTRWVGLTFIRGILTSVGSVQTFNH